MKKYASLSTLAERTKKFGPAKRITLNGNPKGNKEQQFIIHI